MKALLYKEFKLAVHPLCYMFVLLFPIMIIIPSYPAAIGSIYVLSAYPLLFLGANKGQQSNDLMFSTLLPVRKKDIVLARIFTVMILQGIFLAVSSALLPLAFYLHEVIPSNEFVGIPLTGYVSIVAFEVLGWAIADLIYFPIYYKNGKSIVLSTLLSIFAFIIFIVTFTIVIPSIPEAEGYISLFNNPNIGIQFIVLAIAIVIYIATHFAIYKISSNLLEKVDF